MVNDEDPCQLKDEEAAQGWQASMKVGPKLAKSLNADNCADCV